MENFFEKRFLAGGKLGGAEANVLAENFVVLYPGVENSTVEETIGSTFVAEGVSRTEKIWSRSLTV